MVTIESCAALDFVETTATVPETDETLDNEFSSAESSPFARLLDLADEGTDTAATEGELPPVVASVPWILPAVEHDNIAVPVGPDIALPSTPSEMEAVAPADDMRQGTDVQAMLVSEPPANVRADAVTDELVAASTAMPEASVDEPLMGARAADASVEKPQRASDAPARNDSAGVPKAAASGHVVSAAPSAVELQIEPNHSPADAAVNGSIDEGGTRDAAATTPPSVQAPAKPAPQPTLRDESSVASSIRTSPTVVKDTAEHGDHTAANNSRPAAPVEQTPSRRPLSSAAARFAAALERITGPSGATTSAPLASTPTHDGGGDTGMSTFANGHETARPGPTTAPAGAPSTAFVVPVTAMPQTTAAGPVGSAAPPMPAPGPGPDVLPQLVQSMRMQFRDGIGEAVVRLKPEYLGEVSIALRVEQQSVSATVNAEVATVRQWLEAQEPTLRQALAEHGLHLEKLVVRDDERPAHEQQEQQQPRNHRAKRGAARDDRDDATPRFEITI